MIYLFVKAQSGGRNDQKVLKEISKKSNQNTRFHFLYGFREKLIFCKIFRKNRKIV